MQGDPWPETLATPVKLFGNIITASRGETVNGEFLGSGDASIANQSFTLKKSPLTFLPTLGKHAVWTHQHFESLRRWTAVDRSEKFLWAQSGDQIYIVRQNDKNESL